MKTAKRVIDKWIKMHCNVINVFLIEDNQILEMVPKSLDSKNPETCFNIFSEPKLNDLRCWKVLPLLEYAVKINMWYSSILSIQENIV